MIHTDNQIVTWLSWKSIGVMIWGWGLKPHWGQFLMKFILLSVTLDLSDNLTEMCIVKNKIDFQMCTKFIARAE